jgi:hypothetical protein
MGTKYGRNMGTEIWGQTGSFLKYGDRRKYEIWGQEIWKYGNMGGNMGTDGKFSHVSLRTNQKLQEPGCLSPYFPKVSKEPDQGLWVRYVI